MCEPSDKPKEVRYQATKAWIVTYPDPIRGAAGDRLALGRRDDEYPGWVWATAADGRAGWVPERWLRIEGESGVLLCDYTAAELPLMPGDEVSGELVLNGWLWAMNTAGECGWVPLDCLATQYT
jgi:hypothetical protein